jgi:ABC-type spermidine/putrescine transport system permease subunit I
MAAPLEGRPTASRGWARRVPYLLVAPVVIYLVVVVIIPLAIQVYDSFLAREQGTFAIRTVQRFTLANYERIARPDMLQSLVWSIGISLFIAGAAIVVGLPIAHFLARGTGRGKLFVEMTLLLPLFGDIFLAYALLYAFAPQGIVNWALMGLGLIDTPLRIAGTPISAIIAMMLPGLAVLLTRSALQRVDPVYEEAARMLGAGPLRAWLTTTLYLARVGIFGAFLLTFAGAVGAFTLPVILAGQNNDWISREIWGANATGNIPLASALSVTLTVLTVATIYVANRLSNRGSEARRYVG